LLARDLGSEGGFEGAADRRLDVGDDHIDALDGHLVKLEVVGREAIVGDDDVRMLLGGLDVLLEGWLGLVLVNLEQVGQRDLLVRLLLRVLKHTPRKSHIVICVDVDGQVEILAELLTAED